MARISDDDKAARKERIRLLVRRENGIRESGIVTQVGFGQRTVNNYLRELEYEGKIFKKGVLWYEQDFAETELRRFALSAEETLTLYILVRLFVKQTDKRNEIAEQLLVRLAEVLKNEEIVHADILEASKELARREEKAGFLKVYRTVLRGYLFRRRLKISYQPLDKKPFETDFDVYLIEPSGFGHATYLRGFSTLQGEEKTYKLERVVSAEILPQKYDIPTDFPGLDYLRNAWSIYGGDKTVRVKLRFSERVKSRVLESNWHFSQDWDEQVDGSLLWWVDVADTTDIFPWIRQWGGDVEILEPDELCEQMKGHVRKLAERYKLQTGASDNLTVRLLRLWGKTVKGRSDLYHPALYHMLDVGHVAQQLLSHRASPRWRRVLADALGAEADSLHEWLPYLIALHDFGKLSSPFQALNARQLNRLRGEGFTFGTTSTQLSRDLRHNIVGQIVLETVAEDWSPFLREAFLTMMSSHHGEYKSARSLVRRFKRVNEPDEWEELRQHALSLLQLHLLHRWPDVQPQPSDVSAATVALTGFTILCDWLGSDGKFFSAAAHTLLNQYIPLSRQRAYDRVQSAEFFQPVHSTAPTNFRDLFGKQPRPLQAAIDAIPDTLFAHPTLTIIEAPTGEGKTEAAYAIAHHVGVLRGSDEMYIALPTTATSNAMFARTKTQLKRLGLPQTINLVHGQSFLHDMEIEPLVNEDDEPQPSLEWFAPKKRALTAPFGVGTIDQAELSALNVSYNALRMIGLAGKTVILDEVHAYDVYMTTIICRMLRWLAALGSSVVLLSATLPKARRRELAEAFVGEAVDYDTDAYPSLAVFGRNQTHQATPTPYKPSKVIHLHHVPLPEEDWRGKAQWLQDQLQSGGNGCWITNTVERAQEIFKVVQALMPDADLTLLHAALPLHERERREREIAAKFGGGSPRLYKAVVIGTQVLEQSLDLDFDVMMSDIAPVDLLLQRAGRLHRHENHRPNTHATPHLSICYETVNDRLKLGKDRFYGAYILRQTYRAIRAKSSFDLPNDYRTLVEAVYSQLPPDDPDLHDDWEKLQVEESTLGEEAVLRMVAEPDPEWAFWRGARAPFEESDSESGWLVGKTRWGAESLTVVPLQKVGQQARLIFSEHDETVAAEWACSRAWQLRLLHHSVRVSRKAVVKALKDQPASVLFAESALLKYAFPLWLEPTDDPDVFINRELSVSLYLHRELGLVNAEWKKE